LDTLPPRCGAGLSDGREQTFGTVDSISGRAQSRLSGRWHFPQREVAVAKVPPYHTNSVEESPEHSQVYHDHDDCHDGRRIKSWHLEQGTGSKPRCKVCIGLG
jgi:hypothetical protein